MLQLIPLKIQQSHTPEAHPHFNTTLFDCIRYLTNSLQSPNAHSPFFFLTASEILLSHCISTCTFSFLLFDMTFSFLLFDCIGNHTNSLHFNMHILLSSFWHAHSPFFFLTASEILLIHCYSTHAHRLRSIFVSTASEILHWTAFSCY